MNPRMTWIPHWRRHLPWAAPALIVTVATWIVLHMVLPHNVIATGALLTLNLAGGPQQIAYFCSTGEPKGIVILGTGDGGWSYWEENTAKHLADQGFAVGGWDCRKFADSRKYDHDQLCAGFKAAVELVREQSKAEIEAPVWYGGWSTGAEQSVAAATALDRPEHLAGLLLAAPGSRGRYGLTASDLLAKVPTGPGSFSLAELSHELRGIPVAQFAAGLDPLDDTDWLKSYTGPKRIFHLPGLFHDMGNAGARFQAKLDEAIAWTLEHQP
jgi:pimeloyl-ACP methyl ester carboxylesterase